MTEGVYHRPSRYGDGDYPITKALIEDGRNHLILGEAFDPGCPVRILHGLEDPDVPWQHGVATAEALGGDDVTVTLIKGGDHRLSDERHPAADPDRWSGCRREWMGHECHAASQRSARLHRTSCPCSWPLSIVQLNPRVPATSRDHD